MMKPEDFRDAMALYAEADQRATAQLVELVAATILRKLAPPEAEGVARVTLSPADLQETAETHYIDAEYQNETMTLLLTPLSK